MLVEEVFLLCRNLLFSYFSKNFKFQTLELLVLHVYEKLLLFRLSLNSFSKSKVSLLTGWALVKFHFTDFCLVKKSG